MYKKLNFQKRATISRPAKCHFNGISPAGQWWPDIICLTYIVMTGATESRLAIRIPISDIASVSSRARNGSPLFVVTLKNLRNGITPSLAMACSSLGAPGNRLTVYLYQGSYRQV